MFTHLKKLSLENTEIFHKTILIGEDNIKNIIDKSNFCYVDLSFIVTLICLTANIVK